jgi:hypothetical protein
MNIRPSTCSVTHIFACTDSAGRTFTVQAASRNSFRREVEATGRTLGDVARAVEVRG